MTLESERNICFRICWKYASTWIKPALYNKTIKKLILKQGWIICSLVILLYTDAPTRMSYYQRQSTMNCAAWDFKQLVTWHVYLQIKVAAAMCEGLCTSQSLLILQLSLTPEEQDLYFHSDAAAGSEDASHEHIPPVCWWGSIPVSGGLRSSWRMFCSSWGRQLGLETTTVCRRGVSAIRPLQMVSHNFQCTVQWFYSSSILKSFFSCNVRDGLLSNMRLCLCRVLLHWPSDDLTPCVLKDTLSLLILLTASPWPLTKCAITQRAIIVHYFAAL